ncbi:MULTISPECIES: VOC family protein [Alteromonadaceae]|uniref:VOC family protein n=1 Tax=Alteromonadaceae TaxID=72275 RepID=UPI001C09B5D2|nr:MULTISPECIES: VOC family protein [Aliiglaciecola]MBU2876063.1 VOC family protein [Aliiglaciecola lipolytica]MDO6713147.1 VOC family protein [Aliiglaciecola sp. 2_MG-2023]MDO6754179.1 VOC family protein [Aliiglaciecola sp. 1_MG-2023]
MITHIHHINFVVADLDKSVSYFQTLLTQSATIEELPQRLVKTARFKVGESLLVLVQPLSNEGVVADILANKGEGIFLLSFATESIDESLQKLELNNLEKRTGLQQWSICDLADHDKFGAILQLTETPKS